MPSFRLAIAVAAAACVYAAEETYPPATDNDPNIAMVDGRWVKLPPRDVMLGKPNAPPGEGPPPIMFDRERAMEHGIITVLVAAYRETKCPKTLVNLFTKAKHPDRIRIGVIQQNKEDEDVDCQRGMCELLGKPANAEECPYFNQVRMVRMKHTEAKGPVFARAQQIRTIEDNDDFCMQIDAHTDAVQDWDTQILSEWYETENEYAVITTYPTEVSHLNENGGGHWTMPYNCHAQFAGATGLVANSVASTAANMEYPILQPLWAAGLSFARCHAERQVPTDPELKSVFAGEEFGRGSRLWTSGYDFYALRRPVIGTWYGGDKGNHADWRMAGDEASTSSHRLATMLRFPDSDQSATAVAALGKFGLGKKRTLEQYIDFCGINTIERKIDAKCVVKYVPWDWSHDAIAGHAARDNLPAHLVSMGGAPAKHAAEEDMIQLDRQQPHDLRKAIVDKPVETVHEAKIEEDPAVQERRRAVDQAKIQIHPDAAHHDTDLRFDQHRPLPGRHGGLVGAAGRRQWSSMEEVAGAAAGVVIMYYVGMVVVKKFGGSHRGGKPTHLVM
eukprot:m.47631 g.47631  ORF g.47631 m.47631 type:complete len:559 (-) comp6913_c0_seq1:59-1735(-)